MLFFLNSNIDNVGPCRLVVACPQSVIIYLFICFVEPGTLNTVFRSRIISKACYCLREFPKRFKEKILGTSSFALTF